MEFFFLSRPRKTFIGIIGTLRNLRTANHHLPCRYFLLLYRLLLRTLVVAQPVKYCFGNFSYGCHDKRESLRLTDSCYHSSLITAVCCCCSIRGSVITRRMIYYGLVVFCFATFIFVAYTVPTVLQ